MYPRIERDDENAMGFHPDIPSQRIFSKSEQELTSLIQHSYPENSFGETLALKQLICLMLDILACGVLG